MSEAIYDIKIDTLAGESKTLEEGRGQVMLIVNTASKCGFTPQYKGLEELHKDLGKRGLRVLGFPCNQFGAQEPGSDAEIVEFSQTNYNIDFPMFSKIEVNGDGACELYQLLKSAQADEEGKRDIAWNFTKFLVDGDGNVVARFSPVVTPEEISEQLAAFS